MTAKTWQRALIDRHPELFVRTFRGLPFVPGLPNCSEGWRDIVTTVVDRVSASSAGHPIYFAQMSEKYGRLRIYWRAEALLPAKVEFAIEQAIALAEARAACTCAMCGAEGRLHCCEGRLILACPTHAQGVVVPVNPATDRVHIVRRYVRETQSLAACLRYDRAHDRFVEWNAT